jgi:hypothetical protein
VIPFIHILQYQATYGVAEAYHKAFGFQFLIEPEIEIGIGASADNEMDWDWSIPDLVKILVKTVADIDKLGQLQGTQEEVLNKIFAPWRNKKVRDYLQLKYPLLNVQDLDDQFEIGLKLLDKLMAEMKK